MYVKEVFVKQCYFGEHTRQAKGETSKLRKNFLRIERSAWSAGLRRKSSCDGDSERHLTPE